MYEKLTVGLSPLGLCCGVWLRMNFADCCTTNELEFRSCTNCDNIQHKVYKPFEKKTSTFTINVANVCYFFTVNAFIGVYCYFLDVEHV